jgi:hypothetical protein
MYGMPENIGSGPELKRGERCRKDPQSLKNRARILGIEFSRRTLTGCEDGRV